MDIVCQCCGKVIEPGQKAILVSYGYIAKSGRFYNRHGVDVFHEGCDKAFRSKQEPINVVLGEDDKDAAYTGRGANYRRM